jgi:GAF domain-containing protein
VQPGAIQDLSTRLDEHVKRFFGSPGSLPDAEVVMADLRSAQEELRVAEEEIQAQQDELSRLLRAQHDQFSAESRFVAGLPVAVFVTNQVGRILSVNGAGAALVQIPVLNLQGKPLQAYVRPADRVKLRDALAAATVHPMRTELEVRLTPRHAREVKVRLIGHSRKSEADIREIVWLTLPEHAGQLVALDVAGAFSKLIDLALDSADPQQLLSRVADLCAESLGDDVSVTVTLGSPKAPDAVGSSDGRAQQVDGAMIRANEGPSQDAWEANRPILSEDLSNDPRWPKLGVVPDVRAVRTVVAMPINGDSGVMGTLSLFSSSAGRFTADTLDMAELLSASIASMLREIDKRQELARLAAQLERALKTRPVIEQAKGMIMAARQCSDDDAFAYMVAMSRRSHAKLRDVARAIVQDLSGQDLSEPEPPKS